MPKISIITIAYNNLSGLERTFESVFNQSYKDFEYIVIDGGSKDGSKALLEKTAKNLTYWVSEPDNGIYNAMNKGICAAKGEYLLFLNSGDRLHSKDVLKNAIRFLNTGEDIIYGDLEFEGETNFVERFPDELHFTYMASHYLPHPASFIKKSLFETVGMYDESLKIVSDWKFFLLATCKFNCTTKHINQIIANFYMDGISAQEDSQELIKKERDHVLNTEFKIIMKDFRKLENAGAELDAIKNRKSYKVLKKLGYYKKNAFFTFNKLRFKLFQCPKPTNLK